MQMPAFEKHVWAEIDLDALRHNFRAVKARAVEMPLCAVVKADSYGHGAVECAKVFAEEGAAWLAVSCLAEARQLRKAGLTLPILILGHVEPGRVPVLIQEDITASDLRVAAGLTVDWRGKVLFRNVDVYGELNVDLACSGLLSVFPGGHFRGKLQGAHLMVEEGGGLNGEFRVEPGAVELVEEGEKGEGADEGKQYGVDEEEG